MLETIITTPDIPFGSSFFTRQEICLTKVGSKTKMYISASFEFKQRLLKNKIETMVLNGMKEFYQLMQKQLDQLLILNKCSLSSTYLEKTDKSSNLSARKDSSGNHSSHRNNFLFNRYHHDTG